MKTIFLILLPLLFLWQCATENKKAEYEIVKRVDFFTGKSIRDFNITIHSHKEKGLISISGNRERFFFLLPYSEDWHVKYTDNSLIQLNSAKMNLIASITTEHNNIKVESENFLRELKSRIESRVGAKLQNFRIINGSSNNILAYFIEAEKQGLKVKSDNFWSIRQRQDNVIIKLHLSTVNISEEDIMKMEKTLPVFMDTGFRVLTDDDFK